MEKIEKATFAGGCFWCLQTEFKRHQGVISAVSGYSGGNESDAVYQKVASGKTKHREAIQIEYNPEIISYEKLLEIFWMGIDPTDAGGSFFDRGYQYTTAILYHNLQQKSIAEKSKDYLEDSGRFDKPIVTSIEPYKNFYKANEVHQDYSEKNQGHYNRYKVGSGRVDFQKKYWLDKFES